MKIEITKEDWRIAGIVSIIILLVIAVICFSVALGKCSNNKVSVYHYETKIIEKEIASITNNTIYPESIGDCITVAKSDKTMTMACELK